MALAVSAGLGVGASAAFADVTGTVSFEGDAPEPEQINMAAVKECAQQHPDGAFDESIVVNDGKLANVVVSIKAEPGGEVPKQAAVLDQKGCQYKPHVLAVMTGQPISVRNDDPFLHNVHSLAIDNPAFNFGQPNKDPGRKVDPMKVAERFKIKCDVHPWMSAHVSVFEHPYFAVSREDGTFKIPGNLPDGDYKLVAWHEKFGEQEKDIKIAGGKAEGADFSFKAEGASAGDANNPALADVKLAVFNAKSEKTAAKEKACCETGAPSKAKALKSVAKTDAKNAAAEQPQALAK
jgi:plastocyanin